MKYLTTKWMTVTAVAAGLLSAQAGESRDFRKELGSVPSFEMPLQAATLVARAEAQEQKSVTEAVVKAAIEINPAAASAVVGAIAHRTPEMAPLAATTAVALRNDQAGLLMITKSATAGAPSQAGRIVSGVCGVVPADYASVAWAAYKEAPKQSKDIIQAVTAAVPSARSYLSQALRESSIEVSTLPSTADMPVPAIMERSVTLALADLPAQSNVTAPRAFSRVQAAQQLAAAQAISASALSVQTSEIKPLAGSASGTPVEPVAAAPIIGTPFTPNTHPITPVGVIPTHDYSTP